MISIEANVKEAQYALASTSKSLKSITKKTLTVAAKGTVKALKSAIRNTTTKRTGELLKCYGYKATSSKVNIYIKYAKNGDKIFPKVFTLNYGLEGSKRIPKAFVQQGEKYAESNAYMPEVEKMIQKELNKYWS